MSKPSIRRLAMAILLIVFTPSAGWADETGTLDIAPKLRVGTKHSPPFAFKNSDGEWAGISIELWRQSSDELNLEYELIELTLHEMLTGLESGELDAAVAAISVTAERHQRIDFCHPHFTTGLGIAVSTQRNAGNWALFQRVVSTRLPVIFGIMVGIVFVCGLLFWILERKADAGVYDATLLKYLANKTFADSIQVLPVSFNIQDYAIALGLNSPLRQPLNAALLRYRASDLWDELLYRYLGE